MVQQQTRHKLKLVIHKLRKWEQVYKMRTLYSRKGNKKAILLVEDHLTNQKLAILQLDKLGLTVDVAVPGRRRYKGYSLTQAPMH